MDTTSGQLDNPVIVSGARGGGIATGAFDYCDWGTGSHTKTIEGATKASWFARVYTPGINDPDAGMLVCRHVATGNHRCFMFSVQNGNYPRILIYTDGTSNDYEFEVADNAMPTNEWVDLGADWDGVTHEMRIFVNGEQVPSTRTTSGSIPSVIRDASANARLMVGIADQSTTSPDFPFNGYFTSVMMWDRLLTKQEHRQLSADQLAPFRHKSRIRLAVPSAAPPGTGAAVYHHMQQIGVYA